MNCKHYPIRNILTIALLLLSFSSCIKDDLSDCQKPLQIIFEHTDRVESDGITAGELKTAHVYVFDKASGRYMTSWIIQNPQPGQPYEPPFPISSGKYNLVAWFNQASPYCTNPSYNQLSNTCISEEARFLLEVPSSNTITATLPHLLYGNLPEVDVRNMGENTFTIPLVQNTNNIILTVKGLQPTGNTYGFAITDCNGIYKFDNSLTSYGEFSYTTVTTFSGGATTLNTSLRVLTLENGSHPKLMFSDHTLATNLYPSYAGQENDLVALILKVYPGNDFTKKHTYHITLDFAADMSVTVWIDGWKVKTSDNEIFPD